MTTFCQIKGKQSESGLIIFVKLNRKFCSENGLSNPHFTTCFCIFPLQLFPTFAFQTGEYAINSMYRTTVGLKFGDNWVNGFGVIEFVVFYKMAAGGYPIFQISKF